MRIIAGTAKGRKLIAPPGESTRPTSDYVKESMFNIIQFDIEGREVLDLFCGSGQLGLEALSRGASKAVFVDMSAAAIGAVKKNITALGMESQGRAVTGEVMQFLAGYREKADLIFLDPPYRSALLNKALKRIAEIDILRPGGIIVCECAKEDDPVVLPPPYQRGKRYSYGSKAVILYTRYLVGEHEHEHRDLPGEL